jgi:Spy/CpxP family protein refolding chaperone
MTYARKFHRARGSVLIASLCLLVAASVSAQRHMDRPPPPGDRGRDDIHETIQLYFLHRMRDTLNLDDAQTLKLMDLMEQRREEEAKLRDARREAGIALKQLAEREDVRDSEYVRALGQWESVENDMRDLHDRYRRMEDDLMTPRQRVLRRVHEASMRREVETRIRDARRMRRDDRDRPGQSRQERLERLRETDPELYEQIRERMESGEPFTPEERRRMMEERRRRILEDESRRDGPRF